MVKHKYNVTGMTCSACSAHVEKAVRGVQGVSEVSVNLLTNSMVVESDAPLEQDVIVKAVAIELEHHKDRAWCSISMERQIVSEIVLG